MSSPSSSPILASSPVLASFHVLALDCSQGVLQVAVLAVCGEGVSILAAHHQDLGRGHAEALGPAVRDALAEAHMAPVNIDAVVVVTGPGSFTGVRVGVSFANGFAAAHGRPVYGVSALIALAAQAEGGPRHAVIDAGRGQVYLQSFVSDGEPLAPPGAYAVAEAKAYLRADPAPIYGDGAACLDMMAVATQIALAPAVRAALRQAPAAAALPLYLRAPDARLPS